jgi:hypothetical protein
MCSPKVKYNLCYYSTTGTEVDWIVGLTANKVPAWDDGMVGAVTGSPATVAV